MLIPRKLTLPTSKLFKKYLNDVPEYINNALRPISTATLKTIANAVCNETPEQRQHRITVTFDVFARRHATSSDNWCMSILLLTIFTFDELVNART